jgi:hypothetical protein
LDTTLIERLDSEVTSRTEAAFRRRAGTDTVASFDQLDEHRQRRLLRAPEVTRRLLFAPDKPDDRDGFFAMSVGVELALAGKQAPPDEPTWSALGDLRVHPDGTTDGWPQLAGDAGLPLDFGSPWARSIDLRGRSEYASGPRPAFSADEVRLVHRRVSEAMSSLAEVCTTLDGFVRRATCVLVLQIDPDEADHVASGTNGNYIGRSFVTNPHHPDATMDCLTEGIVHEAIHGLLYRESLGRSWVSGEAAVEVPRVRSPWSGRALPVRPFLEAAHVWFGLAHLWALGCRSDEFDPHESKVRLARSVRGFAQGSVVDLVRPWWPDIRSEVIERIDGLQKQIVDALADRP